MSNVVLTLQIERKFVLLEIFFIIRFRHIFNLICKKKILHFAWRRAFRKQMTCHRKPVPPRLRLLKLIHLIPPTSRLLRSSLIVAGILLPSWKRRKRKRRTDSRFHRIENPALCRVFLRRLACDDSNRC